MKAFLWILFSMWFASPLVLAQKAFDHSITGFDLRGAHANIECVACHKQDPAATAAGIAQYRWTGLQKTCYPCHKDYHGYGNESSEKKGVLTKCESCHSDVKWKELLRFDHATDTSYPLTGKHKENDCFSCHIPANATIAFKGEHRPKTTAAANSLRRYEFPLLEKKTCETCHITSHTQAFHNKFKGITCSQCHSTDGWKIVEMSAQINRDRSFHERTRFALTGKHVTTACKSCHIVDGKEQFKFANAEKDFCVSCHKSVHEEQFSERTKNMACSKCHITKNFTERLAFDHNITAFPLTGAHQKIEKKCGECHKPGPDKLPTKPPKTAHIYNFDEDRDAKFCAECHPSPHKNQFRPETLRRSCSDCHSTTSFETLLELKR